MFDSSKSKLRHVADSSLQVHDQLLVQVFSNDDELRSTLAATVSTIRGCVARATSDWPVGQKDFTDVFLILGHLDFENDSQWQAVCNWLSYLRKKNNRIPEVILIADNAIGTAKSINRQKQLLEWGVLQIMVRPLNLQRLRYYIDARKIEFEFWLNQQLKQAKRGDGTKANSKVQRQLAKISAVDTNVLLNGETGVGKTYWAEHIHQQSPRVRHPFVVVNCGNFSPTLVESQMFGHAKGAFTGADKSQSGQFEFAESGTIFLDEIDTLPLEIQAKLLRVVENREFRRLGENKSIPMNARIISATNQKLDDLVEQGKFREDLFYRLNAYEIRIPPLRERISEIESLCGFFAEEFAKANGQAPKSFDEDVMQMLREYPWPGNLRELRNCVQHGAIDTDDAIIHLENLPQRLLTYFDDQQLQAVTVNQADDTGKTGRFDGESINQITYHEVRRLIQALENNDYNRTETAKELGVSRMTVYNMLKRHDLG